MARFDVPARVSAGQPSRCGPAHEAGRRRCSVGCGAVSAAQRPHRHCVRLGRPRPVADDRAAGAELARLGPGGPVAARVLGACPAYVHRLSRCGSTTVPARSPVRFWPGQWRARGLDDLPRSQIEALLGLCITADPEGARLLEAYLDRRFPGWRSADQYERDAGNADGSDRRRARAGSMSEDEAYELLGLAKGARREEIARAHRSLMKKAHPDHGGSTDLAARVNEAKDVLMRRHP